jgi:GDSL-like Lipase/Acylhydrolase family
MAQSCTLWPRFTVPGRYQRSRRLLGEWATRVGRFAVRASFLALVACVIFTGTGLHGGTAGAGAAPARANDATVQVEYKGSETATTITKITTDGSVVQTDLSSISWDLVWSGTLDQLILPFTYSANGNVFVPRTLTGTTKTTWTKYTTRNCTASLSWNPAKVLSMGSTLANGGSDASRIVIGAAVPDSDNVLRSSGTGDCNHGSSYASGGTDLKNLRIPGAVFSLTNVGNKQSQSFSGTETMTLAPYVDTTVINSSITFGGAACTGAGGSTNQLLLFGCYVALGDSYSAGQMPPFVPGGDACLRSTRAYAYLYDKKVAFAACSGAKIADVLSTQIVFVRKTTKLVSITVGGNDSGVIPSFTQCVFRSLILSRCEIAFPAPNFADLHLRLVSLYHAIHSRAPDARLFVFGYPNVLPPTAPSDCPELYLPGSRIGVFPGIGVFQSDVPYFYKLVTKLNDTVHRAAQDSGVATFVSPDLFFAGHDVCAKSSYFFPLAFGSGQTLHPNAEGHAQLAALLRRAAGPPPD